MIQIRKSQRLLCIASTLAFGFLAVSKLGPGWEVSSETIILSSLILLVSIIMFLVSIIFGVISRKSFNIITLPFKIIYFIWITIVVVIYIIAFGYIWLPIQIYQNAFFPGLVVSLGLLLILQWGNRRAFKDN